MGRVAVIQAVMGFRISLVLGFGCWYKMLLLLLFIMVKS